MAKIHVIYDPTEKVQVGHSDMEKQLNLKTASLSIPNDLEYDDVQSIAEQLVQLLLKHL